MDFVDATVPADVREQVLAAAHDELTRWGLERFNVAAMAARHGIDESLIYRYWGNAQRVALDVLLRWSSEVIVAADTGALRTDLQALAVAVAYYVNSPLGRGLLRAMVIDDRAVYSDDTRMVFWVQRFRAMRVVFDRARERGELRDGVDTDRRTAAPALPAARACAVQQGTRGRRVLPHDRRLDLACRHEQYTLMPTW